MKRNIKFKGKKNGFAVLLVGALIASMAIVALQVKMTLDKERGQVLQAIGQAQGLTIGAIAISKKNYGIMPCSPSDFGVQSLPGSAYATFSVSSACHIIVTFADTLHGSLQDAVLDYAPTFSENGDLLYTCSVDNSFFKQYFNLTQCSQKAPVRTAGNNTSGTT
ncbi:hypothetical protein [Paraburkholderia aromaticivorans]|uniref:hypothetical protein n=1 Tax=Paraburkholderia aromaticivorans TaxID=2026199 RepID=UPI0038BD62EE